MKTVKLLIVLSVIISACSSKNQQENGTVPESMGKGSISLSKEQIETIDLKLGNVSERNLSNVVKANGYLDAPPQSKAVISPMITGYVRKVNYLLGDDVRKGQVMAELESIEYIDLQQQYMELRSNLKYLKEDYERQKLLRAQDAVSMKKFLKAEVDLNVANSTLEALTSKLRLLGNDLEKLNQGNIQSKILLRAPITGSVNKLNVQIGKHVDPHEEIYELINTEHLHLELSVYEKDVPKVHKGQKVLFKIASLVNQEFEGEVYLVGQDLSEEKRSINVHVHFDDSMADFAVGMYGTASIAIDGKKSLALPSSSVVEEGNRKFVFRQISDSGDNEVYERIMVTTGIESDGYVELTNQPNITSKDDIVINGAFYLLNVN